MGERIFHGEAADGTCAGCHGSDANGSPQGPSLVSGKWLDSDGTFAGLRHTISEGVPKPKNSSPPMPPRGGAALTDAEVAAVAAYVWAIGHRTGNNNGGSSIPAHDPDNRVSLFSDHALGRDPEKW